MELTDAKLRPLVGGQFEVRDTNHRRVICGEIKSITLVKRGDRVTLNITPEWMAQGVGYPNPARWVAMINIIYKANPLLYTATDNGEGRVLLASEVTGELTTLFPKGQIVLNRNEVEGL